MKHCILAKFTPEAKAQRAALLPRIREIFSAAADIPGVHGAEVIPNCVDRDNRYDVLIRLDMDREALPLYDVSVQSAVHLHGTFHIHLIPRLQSAQVGAVQRFFDGRYRVGVPLLSHDGQANPVMRHTLVYLQFVRERTFQRDVQVFLVFLNACDTCRGFYDSRKHTLFFF